MRMIIEISNSRLEDRETIRNQGYQLSPLDDGFWNAVCTDTEADDLTDLLDDLNLDYRFID